MIEIRSARAFRRGLRDNIPMGQLQFFTSAQLATMRDRTRRRNYSPSGEEFRKEHERHRAWGLQQRHALKRARLSCERRAIIDPEPHDEPAPPPPEPPASSPTALPEDQCQPSPKEVEVRDAAADSPTIAAEAPPDDAPVEPTSTSNNIAATQDPTPSAQPRPPNSRPTTQRSKKPTQRPELTASGEPRNHERTATCRIHRGHDAAGLASRATTNKPRRAAPTKTTTPFAWRAAQPPANRDGPHPQRP
jgi:hypothetical protein